MSLATQALIEELHSLFEDSNWEAVKNKLLLMRYFRQARVVEQYLDAGKGRMSILDLGCGEGQNTVLLSKLGFSVTGVELSHHQSWSKLKQKFVVYDGATLPFKSKSFNAVVMYGVLEHVGSDPKTEGRQAFERNQAVRQALLKEVGRVLKPGGLLFIFNFPNPNSPNELLLDWFKFSTYRHAGSERQTLPQLERLVTSAGFSVLESGRSGVLPVSVGSLVPLVRDLVFDRHYLAFDKLDQTVDGLVGKWLGQSNHLILAK